MPRDKPSRHQETPSSCHFPGHVLLSAHPALCILFSIFKPLSKPFLPRCTPGSYPFVVCVGLTCVKMWVVRDCGTLKVKSSVSVPSALAIQSGMDWCFGFQALRIRDPLKLLHAKTVYCYLHYTEQSRVLTGSWEKLGFWVCGHELNAELRTCSLDTPEPQGFIVLFLPTASALWEPCFSSYITPQVGS